MPISGEFPCDNPVVYAQPIQEDSFFYKNEISRLANSTLDNLISIVHIIFQQSN